MTLRTGTISQQTRAARQLQANIENIRTQVSRKKAEIKQLTILLKTLVGNGTQPLTKWETLRTMTKEAIGKLQKNGPGFIKPNRWRERVTAPEGGECHTQQNAKDECDINIIIKRHAKTGNISHLNPKSPLYMDCTKITDLQGALSLVEEAEDNFATLPAAVRRAANNDPVQFIDMIHSVEGTEELAQAGLEYIVKPQDGGDQPELPGKPQAKPPEPVEPITEKPAETQTPPTPQGGE